MLAPIFIGCSWLRLPNHSRAVVVIPSQWAKVHCARGGHIYSGANVSVHRRRLVRRTVERLVRCIHFLGFATRPGSMKIKWVSHPFVALIRIISSIRPWRENADIRLYVPSARWNTGKVSARASGDIPVKSGRARIRTLSPIFSLLPLLSFIFLTSNVEVHLRRTLCDVRWNVLLAPIFIGCSRLRPKIVSARSSRFASLLWRVHWSCSCHIF